MARPSYIDPYQSALETAVAWAEDAATKPDVQNDIGSPDAWGPTDHVPLPLIEAVVDLESQWNPKAVASWGDPQYAGVGLGQVSVNGMEFGWYETATQTSVSRDALFNPTINLKVTTLGQIGRLLRQGKSNWIEGAIGYYGCEGRKREDRPDGVTSCQEYYDGIRGRIVDWYGEDTAKGIEHYDEAQGYPAEACDFLDFNCQVKQWFDQGSSVIAYGIAIGGAALAVLIGVIALTR